jgi:DNA polymerase I-like protein with 3'-5' exonuclease and polymerase domains
VFVASDFCQLEVRILAHFCEDERLQRFLCDGGDPFTSLASDWLSIPTHAVTETERAKAKQCVYGIVYGMGPGLLAQKLGVALHEASALMRSFSARYPLIKRWEHHTLSRARACSACHTLFRRRRHLPDLHSKVGAKKAAAERQAINSVIQGTASDIMKQAMMAVEERLARLQLGGALCRCVLQIHDELVYEVSRQWATDVGSALTAAMEECVELSVPLRVSTKVGPTLADLR